MIHMASVFPPGHAKRFRSKMNESSKRSGLRTAVFRPCACTKLALAAKPPTKELLKK
jgi:hypothetical protein